ncbi:hypothetical protein BGW36DRAFT_354515 [Talaromyces proteolyticus]|uniref:Uncharacterized protein n=1 Tax=Talaromyces proteolyticus TaxID=1131652 RepID=A0AAD4Q1X8_9EURO|nr:uncharacterized protein BGW36DRAFT_354515 [Talaromyces proteolyticus]KAH8703082.1 hypothetical protein BGW36DRAFT_354515 [Talaromyces proteolyticus]
MPRPALPKPGFSLLRLHNTQNPHHIATLSSAAKTSLIDSIAEDIEGCVYVIGHYCQTGVLDTNNTVQFDQVIRKIKHGERRALRKTLQRMRSLKKQAKKAKKGLRMMKSLMKKDALRKDQEQAQTGSQMKLALAPTVTQGSELLAFPSFNSDVGNANNSSDSQPTAPTTTTSAEVPAAHCGEEAVITVKEILWNETSKQRGNEVDDAKHVQNVQTMENNDMD